MDYKDYNDYELLYMVKENDDFAINIMIDKYKPIIKNLAYTFYINYNKCVEIEDLVQEGMIAVFKTIGTYNDSKFLFYTYVCKAIKNAMTRYCKIYTNNKNKALIYSDGMESVYYIGYEIDYLSSFIDIDFYAYITRFKNGLSFIDSCIFELRFNSFSYLDIASLLGIKKKDVDNKLYKIKKKLKKYLLSYRI